MQSRWPILKNSPIVIAILQIKFSPDNIDLINKHLKSHQLVAKTFPIKHEHHNIDLLGFDGTHLQGGKSFKVKGDPKIVSTTYSSSDQKRKFIVEKDCLTFLDETKYDNWSSFTTQSLEFINIFCSELSIYQVIRTSIRFVNKFVLDQPFNELDYFTKTISTETETIFPTGKYSYKIEFLHKKEPIIAIVNQAIEPNSSNQVEYYIDIDVLDSTQISYEQPLVLERLEILREMKNEIFFDIVKTKTLDLCN